MLNLTKIIGFTLLLSFAVMGPSCGMLKKDKGDDAPGVPGVQNYSGEIKKDPNGPITMDLTATYDPNPKLDFIIIMDASARNNSYVQQRLAASWDSFAARLGYLGNDIQVGIFSTYNPAAVAPAIPVAATVDATITKPIIGTDLSSAQFTAAISARMLAAGQGTGAYAPVAILNVLNAERKKDASGAFPGFPRKESTKVVLLFNASNVNPQDPGDVDDFKEIVADWGATVVSAIAPEKDNCAINASPLSETNSQKRIQRNEEIKLVAASNGYIASVCQKSYSVAIEELITKGSGTQYFPVDIPTTAKPETIKISVDGQEVKEFAYIPDTKTIQVSRKIKAGTKFQIVFIPVVPLKDPLISSDPKDPNVPNPGGGTLSPQQQFYYASVKPILSPCMGCHSFYATYEGAVSHKTALIDRVQRPVGAAGFMPQGATTALPAASIQILMSPNW